MRDVLDQLSSETVDFYQTIPEQPVMQAVSPGEIRAHLVEHYDFQAPIPLDRVMKDVSEMMHKWNVHTTHRRPHRDSSTL